MRHAFPILLVAVLTGCAVDMPLGEPDFVAPGVRAQAEALRSPLTTRKQVQAALGTPVLSAPDGAAEVFHLTDKQQQLTLVGIFPAILPVPGFSVRHTAHTLVAYDTEGTVTAVDAAYRRTDFATWRNDGTVLRAGDFEFVHGLLHGKVDRVDLLLVAPERYVAMRALDAPICTVLVGCGRPCPVELPGEPAPDCSVCWTRLQVDEGPIQELPLQQWTMWRLTDDTAPDAAEDTSAAESRCQQLGGRVYSGPEPLCILSRYALLPLRLPPGKHRFVASSKSLDGEARGESECAAGEVVYAALDGEVTQNYSFTKQLGAGLRVGAATGRITFSPEPPPGLEGQRVILNW